MNDNVFHWTTILIQAIGLIIVVFGGGRFIGEIKQSIKQLFINDKDLADALKEHRAASHESFKEINNKLYDLRRSSNED